MALLWRCLVSYKNMSRDVASCEARVRAATENIDEQDEPDYGSLLALYHAEADLREAKARMLKWLKEPRAHVATKSL